MKFYAKLLVFSISLFLVLSPVLVFGQSVDSCDCFCASSGGALEIPNIRGINACQDECSRKGTDILGCYTDEQSNLRPENSSLCWTPSECRTEFDSRVQEGNLSALWDQARYWEQSSSCLQGEGACYPPTPRFNLNVPLSGLRSVDGIVGYVNVAYSVLLVAASVLSVLVIMFAGLKWMTARGNPSQVDSAKQMIGRALVTVVVLLSITALAEFIDPRLTRFDILKTGLVNQVQFIPEGASCEQLMADHGATVTAKTNDTTCGNEGIIEDLGTLADGLTVGITVGDTCTYQRCANGSAESCLQVQGEWECLRCGNIVEGMLGEDAGRTGLHPSETVCSNMTLLPAVEDQLAGKDIVHMCQFYDSAWSTTSGALEQDACVELVYQSDAGIKCENLRDSGLGCQAYENVTVQYRQTLGGQLGSFITGNGVKAFEGENGDFPLLKNICDNDICGLSTSGCSFDMRFEQVLGFDAEGLGTMPTCREN